MDETLLAFDLGTTGAKAALVNAETGRVIASATAGYPTRYTPDGGAEQSPEDWWNAVIRTCHELAMRAPEALASVAAIGCGGMMNGVVLVDAQGNTLRDAILHADVRSAPQNRVFEASVGRDALFQATANRPDCHLTLPKLLWLQAHEPEQLARAAFIVQAKDYLVGRLTGRTGLTDPSDASLTGGFDVAQRVWADAVWAEANLPTRLLPNVVPSTEVVGWVTDAAASATGLRAGTPVVMGGGDGACATAGSGVGLGDAYNYLGGTSWIGLSAAQPLYDDRLSNYCSLDGTVTIFGTVQAAGSSLEWFSAALGIPGMGHDALDDAARTVPPGARNLFFLPYLQGERAPLWDAEARGVFFGLAASHTRADLFRAVIEGVSFALRSVFDVFTDTEYPISQLRLLGGGAKSTLWRTILAGVYACPVQSVTDVSSATSLGAAMAAGVGVGLFSDWDTARRLIQVGSWEAPDPILVAAYAPRIAFFETLYPALRERFAALAELG